MTLSSLQCADVPWGMTVGNTIGTLLVFLAGHLQFLNINIFFSNKTYGSNSSNGTRKLVWFEITKVLIAV